MTSTLTTTGVSTPIKNRYRMPGIEREGIAQLSLLETALWPLQGGKLHTPQFETSYSYSSGSARKEARVTVRSALGLNPIDEYILYGLLGATLKRKDADPLLLATPYWMLKHLCMDTGGSQYVELRKSLLRLTTTSYQNTAFYNPETQEHEYAAFQFLSMLLPTVSGLGDTVDNNRCWRIEWNPAFFRFCQATGGNLLFDLDLYKQLSPASRRLFLKLKDRFWRSKRVFFNIDDLTINGLGFSPLRPLYKRKYDLVNCLRELLVHQIVSLGRGQTDVSELIIKRSKGCYVVSLYEGEYFRRPLAERTTTEKKAIADDPLFQPLKQIGVDEPAIRRLFEQQSRANIQRWLRITDAALHEQPRGFPGFKVSPAAFLVDAIQHNRLPPDWMYAHEKHREKQQWEQERNAFDSNEQELRSEYDRARQAAFQAFLQSPLGKQKYDNAYRSLITLYRTKEPERAESSAHEATLARLEKLDFQFPGYAVWALQRPRNGGSQAGE